MRAVFAIGPIRRHRARVRARRRLRVAPWLLCLLGMADADLPQEPRAGAIVHQFTVNRGMTLVLVIETTYWYSGLLQAALARITLEGQN